MSPFANYAKTNKEQVWFVNEPTFNVLAQPDVLDQVDVLPGVSLPPVLREFTQSLERSPSAGVSALIKRKKRPGAFTIPLYIKAPGEAGAPPQVGIALRKGFGTEVINPRASFLTAIVGTNNDITWTARAGGTGGNTISVEYVVSGLNTPLSIVVTGRDIVVNVATDGAGAATSTANDVVAAVNASAAARALVTLVATEGDGTGIVDTVAQTSLSGGTGTSEVQYQLATDIEELSFSIWHYKDNLMSGFRGCLSNVMTTALSGTDEGRLTVTGFTGNEVFAGVTVLAAAVSDGVVTSWDVGLAGARVFQVGPVAATDRIYLQIEDEIVLLTAVDYATGLLTVVRAQKGTTGVAHAISTELGPWVPGADQEPDDIIAPIVLGSIVLTGETLIGIAFTQEVNNQLEPRIDEYAQDTLTGYRRTGKRTVTGTIRAYALQAWQKYRTNLEREFVEDAAVLAGSAGTSTVTIDMDRCRLDNLTEDGGGPEFIYEFTYQALETATPGNDETVHIYA